MKIGWMLGLLLLAGLTSLSAQTPDDDFVSESGMSNALEPTALECMLFAQVSGDKPPVDRIGRGPGHGRHDVHREGLGKRQRKQLDQLRMLKMLELLDLREDQEVEFLTAFNRMRKEQRQLEETGKTVTDSLARELRSGNASETRLNALVDRVLVLQHEKHSKMIGFVEQSRAILTAEQVGKLVIFQKRFESEILERIGRFRKGMRPGPGEPPEDEG